MDSDDSRLASNAAKKQVRVWVGVGAEMVCRGRSDGTILTYWSKDDA